MKSKIASALLLSAALLAPSISSAQDLPPLDQVFANRGECESTLKRARNIARQTVKQSEAGSGQTNALINRLANPAIKFICTAATGKDGKTVFKIIEQA